MLNRPPDRYNETVTAVIALNAINSAVRCSGEGNSD
jgi:hypothetical protein